MGGGLAVTRNGKDVRLGPNPKAILHALVLGMGVMHREKLEQVLPWRPASRKSDRAAVKNALTDLRREDKLNLDIGENDDPVVMSLNQPGVWVDLWEFFEHVAAKEYEKARALIPAGEGPRPLVEGAPQNDFWGDTFERFDREKHEVLSAIEASSGRNRMMLDTRERLLERSLVPGVGREVPIAAVRESIEAIPIPWRCLRPAEGKRRRDPLPAQLAVMLSGTRRSRPKHLVVVGPHGLGKTLVAISTYLRLTDSLEDTEAAANSRPIFYVDGQRDAYGPDSEPPLASDAWFEQRLQESDALGHGRPILIMSHADRLLSQQDSNVGGIVNSRVFKESDVLLCCCESFYEEELKFKEYPNSVFRLERWAIKDQKALASALFKRKTWGRFETWRNADESGLRGKLCSVPLHLSFVLPLVEEESDALESISTRWHFLDQLARVRLNSADLGAEKEQLMSELGEIAHHFYVAGKPDEQAIAFSRKGLEELVRSRNAKNVEERLVTLIHGTLIAAPSLGHVDYRFEEPAWGFFFVALHLSELLKSSKPRQPVLKAFGKPFSKPVLELCEEMLSEEFGRHEEAILRSLQSAQNDKDASSAVTPAQRKTAEAQVGRLLKLLEQG